MDTYIRLHTADEDDIHVSYADIERLRLDTAGRTDHLLISSEDRQMFSIMANLQPPQHP